MTEVVFTNLDKIGLYITRDATTDTARFLYVNTRRRNKDDITLEEAWKLPGSGVFCFLPRLPQKSAYKEFVRKINRSYIQDNSHFLLWIRDPNKLDEIHPLKTVRRAASEYFTQNLRDYSIRNSTLRLDKFCECGLNADHNGFRIIRNKNNTPRLIRMLGASGKISSELNVGIGSVELQLSTQAQGILAFDVDLTEANLNALDVGLRYFLKTGDSDEAISSVCYPVFNLADNAKALLRIQFDPFGLKDERHTYYSFRDRDQAESSAIGSYFRTSLGHAVGLQPNTDAPPTSSERARLLFADLPDDDPGGDADDEYESVYLLPAGNFQLTADTPTKNSSEDKVSMLLCGLSGTETLSFVDGADALRFTPGKPAYAPGYPFGPVSPVGPPTDPSKLLLDDTYTTSWISLLRSGSETGSYIVQPKGATLYGYSTLEPNVLGYCESGVPFPEEETPAFPLLPYAGIVAEANSDKAQVITNYEAQVIAPARQQVIAEQPPSLSRTIQTRSCTTASGMIVGIKPDGSWAEVKLGQKNQPHVELKFTELQPELQHAFQSNQLFLVIANAQKIGALVSSLDSGEKPPNAFYKTMLIEEWQLDLNVGQDSSYGDYTNVLILKFRLGTLRDLVKNPDLWNEKAAFAPPGNSGHADVKPDLNQLVILSQWLQDYIEQAISREDPLLGNFRRIVTNPNWTGILALKVTVTELPKELAGLLAGIDRSQFYAHHFGIAMNMIDGKMIDLAGDSATFGLIDYVDRAYVPPHADAKPKPIAPDPGAVYDFKVLVLRALFENAAVKTFESTAQLTLNELFGEQVVHMGDPENLYNTIVLQGSYQHQDGKDLYILDTVDDNSFYFESNILNKVEIVKARFSSISENRSRFSLWGFMDFKVISKENADISAMGRKLLDLFSFGNQFEKDDPRKGLRYSDLAIDMKNDSNDKTEFIFDASNIAFDPRQSTVRDSSLYQNFALKLDGLVQGNADTTPQSLGYLPVMTDFPLTGIGDQWYGLRFRLNMGSPGELAGKVSLTSHLLLAWSSGSSVASDSYSAQIGLKLPGASGGAKLLSLQGVMQLSIGDIRLLQLEGRNNKLGSFMMVLTEIALKFMGLLKLPPNGATAFYLFGNPKAEGMAGKLGWYAVYNQNRPKTDAEKGVNDAGV